MRHKIKILLTAVFCALIFATVLPVNQTVYAVPCNPDTDLNCSCSSQGCDTGNSAPVQKKDTLGNGCDKKLGICSDNPIVKDLNIIVGFLSGLVGVVVVGVIILGGIQYAMAGDKAEAVSAAKKRIINGLTALIAFLFIFAFLQWLIPGGIFK